MIDVSENYKYMATSSATDYVQEGGTHQFKVAPSGTSDAAITWTTAMKIDNVGMVLVGKNSSGVSVVGAEFRNGVSDYALLGTSSSAAPLILNRTASDGEIIKLRKDNTDVGRIKVTARGE
jgi:hypothetical protein